MHGTRTGSKFTIAVTFDKLQKTTYTRWIIGLIDPSTGKGRALEVRSGRTKGAQIVTFYKLDESQSSAAEEATCRGASVKSDYSKSRIVYTIPASCYPGSSQSGAVVLTAGAAWTKSGWTMGGLGHSTATGATPPDSLNSLFGLWSWTSPTTTRSAQPHEYRLF